MQDIHSHPTLRFLTAARPYIQVIPPFPVLAYEHTPQSKRKTLQFHVQISSIPKEDIVEVGVIPIVKEMERIDVIYAGGKAEPTEESGRYIFKNLQLDKPKDRGVTCCFLRFYVRTRREYRMCFPLSTNSFVPIFDLSSLSPLSFQIRKCYDFVSSLKHIKSNMNSFLRTIHKQVLLFVLQLQHRMQSSSVKITA